MATSNDRAKNVNQGQRGGKARGQRGRDEDDHPIEGYRDGSVFEEEDDGASPGQANQQTLPDEPQVNGGLGGDGKKPVAKSAKKRKRE